LERLKDNRVSSAAMIVMSSVVLSRLTGFIRETMLSWKVGLSWVQDAYVAAFTVPDLMYILLVGGTISAAVVPFLSGRLEKKEERDGWKAVSTFINAAFIIMVILCGFGMVFAEQIIPAVAPGFEQKSPQTQELAIMLTRILFPSVSFIMLAGMCNGVLNSYKKFAAAAYGPSIYNAGCAVSILLFADTNPGSMVKVAYGVAASAALYFLIQLLFALPQMKFYRPVIDLADKGFRTLLGQAVPSLLASSAAQVNVIIATAFVSLSAYEGGLAAFRNANTLWQLPHGIFALGLGTAVLPSLSGKYASGDHGEYKHLLMKSLTSVLFAAVPSAVGFVVLGKPLVRAVYKWGGKFTEADVELVASIMVLFAVSIVTASVVTIMNRAFYALQDTKTPLMAAVATVIMNFGFGLVFYLFTDLGPAGMALTYSITSLINVVLLLILMNRKVKGISLDRLRSFFNRAVPAALIMGVVLAVLESIPVRLDTKLLQLSYLTGEILLGAAVYAAMMLLLKSDDAIYLLKMLKVKRDM